jgi:O-antigen/teichoic acid export membrane protein
MTNVPTEVPATAFGPAALVRRVLRLIGGVGHGERLARGAVMSLIVVVGGSATAFAVQVLLARLMGKTEYGTYIYVLGWLNAGMVLSNLQLDACSPRFVAAYLGTKAPSLLRGYLSRSRSLVMMSSTGLAAVVALLLYLFRDAPKLTPSLLWAGWVACALLPFAALLNLGVCTLQGFQRVLLGQVPNNVVRPAVTGLAAATVVWLLGRTLAAPVAVALNGLATIVAFVLTARAVSRVARESTGGAAPEYRTGEWLRTAMGLMLVSVAQLILSQQSDVLVVGSIVDTAAAGTYGAASQLASLASLAVGAVSFLGAPMIAALHAQRRTSELEQLVKGFGRVNLLVTIPILAVLAVFGRLLLGAYGHDFASAYPVLLILGGAQLVLAAVGVQAGFVLTMTGHERQAGYMIAASALLNIALSLALTPMIGLVGTAAATTTATLARAIALAIYIKRKLGISVVPW